MFFSMTKDFVKYCIHTTNDAIYRSHACEEMRFLYTDVFSYDLFGDN
jgi:hypothetical protein